MKKYCNITPEGTRDLLFEECIAHRNVEHMLAAVFESRGFQEVITPGLEFFDVFSLDCAGIPQESMYKLTDHKGRLLVLRPDSTLPIARMTATRLQNEGKPLRLYYTQTVYRNNPSLMGRSDEVMQTGIELLGASGKRADLEVMVTAIEALSRCVPDFRMELGHAGFFRSLANQLPISDEIREDIRLSIESKNYSALDTILDRLEQTPAVLAIRRLPRLFGGEEVLQQAAELCPSEDTMRTLDYLKELYLALREMGLGEKLIIDLGLVQRNDYYSDIVFSGYVEGSGDAVLTGGRYDHLLEAFGAPMPAVGFGINVDALTKLMLESGNVQTRKPADVLVHGDDGFEMKALKHSAFLLKGGLRCENSVFTDRQEALQYARKKRIPRVDYVSDHIETVSVWEKGGKG